jgi:hypothetical protein
LKNVIAINLLGGEDKHWKKDPELVRHYKFTSEVGGHRHELDSLQLIQYNLLSPQIDGLGEVELKEWLDFWRGAHQREADEVARVATATVRSAYDRVRVTELPEGIRAGYDAEVADYLRYSHHIQYKVDEASKRTREEERLKSVRRMLAKGLSDADINELADLKEGELDQIKERLKDVK